MKKSIIKLILPLALIASMTTPIFATDVNSTSIVNKEHENELKKMYNNFQGTVTEINDFDAIRRVTVKNDSGGITIFNLQNNSLIYNEEKNKFVKATDVKKDDSVVAFYLTNTPVVLSYPPQINAEGLVIVNKEVGTKVKIDVFNKEFVASDSMLKLNVTESTKIVNSKGENVKKDSIINKKVIVFYTIETRSIPPQTAPSLIIVLDDILALNTNPVTAKDILDGISKEDYAEVDGNSYVKLSAVTEKTGHSLYWNAETSLVTATKGDKSILFIVGEDTYKINLDSFVFEIKPIILKDRTYISTKFVQELVK